MPEKLMMKLIVCEALGREILREEKKVMHCIYRFRENI